MTPAQLTRGGARAGFGVCLLLLFSCAEHAPTAPELARGGAGGGGGGKGPTVKSTNPPNGARGTTLDVHVLGTGFDAGSRARWALDGDTTVAITKVITNSTTYVSSTELIANITIGTDANLDLYDVMVVTGGGKKGIGIEKFEVTVLINFLPDLGGTSTAWDINSSGVIVGGSGNQAGTTYNPVSWTRIGNSWTIATLAGSANGVAWGINDGGTVVGQSAGNAYVWTAGGVAVNLGPGSAFDINESETVVGYSGGIAAVWTKTSATTWSVPVLLPGQSLFSGEPLGINDANVVAGSALDANGAELAARWEFQDGQWVGPTIVDNTLSSYIWDINDHGDMAGGFCSGTATSCLFDAVFWPSGGTAEILPTLGGWASATGLNNVGEVVGGSYTLTRRNRIGIIQPVLWANGILRKLFIPPGYGGGMANDINDNGQAVGSATGSSGADRAVVWTLHP